MSSKGVNDTGRRLVLQRIDSVLRQKLVQLARHALVELESVDLMVSIEGGILVPGLAVISLVEAGVHLNAEAVDRRIHSHTRSEIRLELPLRFTSHSLFVEAGFPDEVEIFRNCECRLVVFVAIH